MANAILSRRCILGATATVLLAGAAPAERVGGVQFGDGFVAVDDARKTVLQGDAIRSGAAPVLAWPIQIATQKVRDGARLNQVLLLRLADDQLVAFSALCPHAGCLVSEWLAQPRVMLCPCHGS